MNDKEINVVGLAPMRVASFCTFGKSPEEAALKRMRAWAEPKRFLDDTENHPIFGFDNPPPSKEGEEYGYEVWIKIGREVQSQSEIECKDFGGGVYAVLTCEVLGEPWKTIPAGWQSLIDWMKSCDYECGSQQHLEKYRNPGAPLEDLVLELYCPLKEK